MSAVHLLAIAPVALEATESTSPDQSAHGDRTPQRDIPDLIAAILGRDRVVDAADTTGTDEDEGDSRFFVFPTLGGNPSIGVAAGALGTFTNYWGDPSTTPLSSLLMSASFTSKRQVLIAARSDIYAPDEAWHLTGDWRYYDFEERTYGLGSDRADTPFVDVGYDWYRIHQVAYRPVWGALEAGVGYHLDVRRGIAINDDQQVALQRAGATPIEATTSSGLSLNVGYDTRDHPLNPERGVYGRASYVLNRTGLGSDSDWENLQLEGRVYQRLPGSRRQIVAGWAIVWLTRGGQVPYFDRPGVGWDTYGRTARGYTAGRFRGRDWVYTEFEYRADLTRDGLLGAVAFVNASRLSGLRDLEPQRWVPAGGAGIRLKLDKNRRSNIAIDVAWGREGSVGLYLGLNEAF